MGKRRAREIWEYDSMAEFEADGGAEKYGDGFVLIGGDLFRSKNSSLIKQASENQSTESIALVTNDVNGALTGFTRNGVSYTVVKSNGLVNSVVSPNSALVSVPIFDFNSTDSSIVLKSSLTSAISITSPEIGGANVTGLAYTNSYDPVLGMKIRSDNTGNAGARFLFATAVAALQTEGQISFDVETSFLAAWHAASGSISSYATDDDGSDNRYMLQWDALDSNGAGLQAGQWGFIRKSSAGTKTGATASSGFLTAKTTHNNVGHSRAINSWGKEGLQFSRVCFAWKNGFSSLYINGELIEGGIACVSNYANFMKYLYVGSLAGLATRGHRGVYYRNLVIATKAPVLAHNPSYEMVATVGDSYATGSLSVQTNVPYANGASCLDETLISQVNRQLAMLGRRPKSIGAFGVAGGSVDAVTQPNPIYQIDNAIAKLVADQPSHLIWTGGNNDVESGSFLATRFELYLKSIFMQIAIGCPNLKKFIVMTIPYHGALESSNSILVRKNIDDANSIIKSLPSWWGNIHRCQLIIVDQDKILGSDGLTVPNAFAGQTSLSAGYTSSLNNLHISGYGHFLVAKYGIVPLLFN